MLVSYGGMGYGEIWISVVCFADMDICSPFAVLVSCSFGRFGSPVFFWQLLVSYGGMGRFGSLLLFWQVWVSVVLLAVASVV